MTRELCKRCWRFNPVGFSVPDEVWNRVVPEEFRNRVLCIMCFDYFATENGVDWVKIAELYPVSGVMHRRSERNLAVAVEQVLKAWDTGDDLGDAMEGLRVAASVHARFDGDEMDFEVVEISGGDEA